MVIISYYCISSNTIIQGLYTVVYKSYNYYSSYTRFNIAACLDLPDIRSFCPA